MALLTEKKYSFAVEVLDRDTFGVVEFSGVEGLSQPYRFEVMLVSEDREVDFDRVMQSGACFTIHREEGRDCDFHGVLERFEQLHSVGDYTFYRATLVPKLQWLSHTCHNQVFLDKSVPEIVEAALKDGGLTALDYEFRLSGAYEKRRYVCQYGETHLGFISRWLEREGIYYFFEQGEGGEKIVFTDNAIGHSHGATLSYSPPSGLDDERRGECVQTFTCRRNPLPKSVKVKDYNYRKPALEMVGNAEVDGRGRGEVYYYGEHFRTPEEGNRIARVRAEELLCRKEEYTGESTVPDIQSGYLFDLRDHYRGSFNQKYLPFEVNHDGSQTRYLLDGVLKGLSDREQRVYYRNRFKAIPASVQYRPQRAEDGPRISGTLHGHVDAAGSGQYAELDEHGRYKVRMSFDESGRKDGKASAWVRMAQPYAGSDHGMHFPLHKGTEVLLSFLDGNPDRPIIQGAVTNPDTPSQVTSADQTMSKITTAGGNKIHMEDEEGRQRILLLSPSGNTWVRLGSHNDPDDPPSDEEIEKHEEITEEEDGYKISTEDRYVLKVGNGKMEIVLGTESKMVIGNVFQVTGGGAEEFVAGANLDLTANWNADFKLATGLEFAGWIHRLGEEEVTLNLTHEALTIGANKAEVHGDHTTVNGTVSEITGNRSRVDGDVTDVTGDDCGVAGNVTKVTGDHTFLDGSVTRVDGNKTLLVGNASRVTGEKTRVSGAVSEVNTDKVRINGDVQEITAGTIRVSSDQVDLHDFEEDV